MIIPSASHKKALFIIDVQPQTFNHNLTSIVKNIVNHINRIPYDAYVIAEYHAPLQSMFHKQQNFTLTKELAGSTCPSVLSALKPYKNKVFNCQKTTRSCFKSENSLELHKFLKDNEIEEIHLVGMDINDCVFATAYDAIDLKYFSFVIEELSHHNGGNEQLKNAAIELLRHQKMTNNSLDKKIKYQVIP